MAELTQAVAEMAGLQQRAAQIFDKQEDILAEVVAMKNEMRETKAELMAELKALTDRTMAQFAEMKRRRLEERKAQAQMRITLHKRLLEQINRESEYIHAEIDAQTDYLAQRMRLELQWAAEIRAAEGTVNVHSPGLGRDQGEADEVDEPLRTPQLKPLARTYHRAISGDRSR